MPVPELHSPSSTDLPPYPELQQTDYAGPDAFTHLAGSHLATSVPTIPRLVGIQQTIAGEMSCGFFNTYLAMGGPGTMGRWYEAEPRLVGGDFIHPMPGGAKIVGNLLYQALFDAYNQYKVRRMQERLAKVSGKP